MFRSEAQQRWNVGRDGPSVVTDRPEVKSAARPCGAGRLSLCHRASRRRFDGATAVVNAAVILRAPVSRAAHSPLARAPAEIAAAPLVLAAAARPAPLRHRGAAASSSASVHASGVKARGALSRGRRQLSIDPGPPKIRSGPWEGPAPPAMGPPRTACPTRSFGAAPPAAPSPLDPPPPAPPCARFARSIRNPKGGGALWSGPI